MTIELFEEISLTLGMGGLILYMIFIMYRLGKEAGAGRFGGFVIFLGLGMGVVGFAAKSVIQALIHV